MATFNLLPQKEQDIVTREYKRRLLAFSFLLLSSLAFTAILALIPSYVLLSQKAAAAEKIDSALSSAVTALGKDSAAENLRQAGAEISLLARDPALLPAHELINAVIRDKTGNIVITGIRVESGSLGRTITVLGKAADRNALVALADALKSDKSFSAVNVPMSNFTAASNLDFSLLISAK